MAGGYRGAGTAVDAERVSTFGAACGAVDVKGAGDMTGKQQDRGDSAVVWQDPPPRQGWGAGRGIDPRRKAMDAEPGRWLLWASGKRNDGTATYLRRLGYETTRRGSPTTGYDVYARRPKDWTPEQ